MASCAGGAGKKYTDSEITRLICKRIIGHYLLHLGGAAQENRRSFACIDKQPRLQRCLSAAADRSVEKTTLPLAIYVFTPPNPISRHIAARSDIGNLPVPPTFTALIVAHIFP
jgi:hypothetical protein